MKQKKEPNDKTKTGLIGEFYALAQLAQRGFLGQITLANTKAVDIVVYADPKDLFSKRTRLDVKTKREARLVSNKIFGPNGERFYKWVLRRQNLPSTTADDLVFCFVVLLDPATLPIFFLVPSRDVVDHVAWGHDMWMKTTGGKDSDTRNFLIDVRDPKGYRDNWAIFR